MKTVSRYTRTLLLGMLALIAVSCGSQPTVPEIPGMKGPFFNVMDGKVLISMTFDNLEIIGGGRFPLSKMPNSFIELSPGQTGGTFLQVSLDIVDIDSTDWGLVDPNALPGGRPLPGVVGGRLPSLAVNVPSLKDTTFYVSKQIFGFFIPFKIGSPGAILTFRIFMEEKHIGNVSLVGEDQRGENSGMLMLMNLDRLSKARLQKLIDFSKQSKNRGKLF